MAYHSYDTFPYSIILLLSSFFFSLFFFFNDTATTEIYTLSLHDALPISNNHELFEFDETGSARRWRPVPVALLPREERSEEHTSELQSRPHLVCRLLLEKKKKKTDSSLQYTSRAVT